MDIAHAIATALNASLVILRSFKKDNENNAAKITHLFQRAYKEDRDIGADEILEIIQGAEKAKEELEKAIEEKTPAATGKDD